MTARWARFGLVALAACQNDQSVFAPQNDRASQLAGIGWVTVLGFTLVGIVMWILLGWAAMRRRGTYAEHAPAGLDDGKRWIYVGGVLVPGFVFVALLAVSIARMHTASPMPHHAMHPDIRVIGHRWWWEVQYLDARADRIATSANEIHIPVHTQVTIELASADVIHSFWVPNLQGKVDLVPGHTNAIQIAADAPGIYEGQCSEFCGLQHAHMRLLVVAESADEHVRFLSREREPAAPPASDKARRGLEVFESSPCATCHTIRGTRGLGHIGPDLTHLASRHRIASNSFPLVHGYLDAWSVRAQSLKPGAEMPDLTALTGEQLDALGTYLMGLR